MWIRKEMCRSVRRGSCLWQVQIIPLTSADSAFENFLQCHFIWHSQQTTPARLSVSILIQHWFMRQGIVLFSRFWGFAINMLWLQCCLQTWTFALLLLFWICWYVCVSVCIYSILINVFLLRSTPFMPRTCRYGLDSFGLVWFAS